MVTNKKLKIERVQTGVRIEKKILKVLRGMADYNDLSVGQMLEIILLHAFESRPSFSKEGLEAVKGLKKVHSLDNDVHDYLKFVSP